MGFGSLIIGAINPAGLVTVTLTLEGISECEWVKYAFELFLLFP